MATATSSQPTDEQNTRLTAAEEMGDPQYPSQQQEQQQQQQQQQPGPRSMPQQQRHGPPPPYGGPPPPHMAGGNGAYWGPQYGHPQAGPHPPPAHAAHGSWGPMGYPPGRMSSPDRGSSWNPVAYRGGPPPRKQPKPGKHPDMDDDNSPYWGGGAGGPPPSGPPPPYGASARGPPPPPPGYYPQGSGGIPPGMYAAQGPPWSTKSPPRMSRSRPDMMYRGGPPDEMGYLSTRTIQHHDDDGASSSAGGSGKDKGRGSYKCGRCGVPKKGHVCPYQPKVKRRPDEPPPETRNAAVQVERDEFMTLRRLNIRIQGFPESYATEPYMGESMVAGEPMAPVPLPQEDMILDRGPPARMIPAGPAGDGVAVDMVATTTAVAAAAAVAARGGGPPPDVMQQPTLSAASPDAPPSSSPINTTCTSPLPSHEIGVGDDPIDPQPKNEA